MALICGGEGKVIILKPFKLKDKHGTSLVVEWLRIYLPAPGNTGSIPGLGRSPGEGNGNSLQYSCLENPVNRGAWRAAVHRVAQSWTQLKRLSMHAYLCSIHGLGGSAGGKHFNPLQYSCLENPHGQRSLAGCSPWDCKESDTTE